MAADLDVTNNVLRDLEDAGIIVAAVNNTRIAHNTLVRTAKGAGAAIELLAAQKWVSAALQPVARVDYLLLANNLVATTNDTATPVVAIRRVNTWSGSQVGALGSGVRMTANVFVRLPSPPYTVTTAGSRVANAVPQRLPFHRSWHQRATVNPHAVTGLATVGAGPVYVFDNTPGAQTLLLPALNFTQATAGGSGDLTSPLAGLLDDNLAPLPGNPAVGGGANLAAAAAGVLSQPMGAWGGGLFVPVGEDARNRVRASPTAPDVGALLAAAAASSAPFATRQPPRGPQPMLPAAVEGVDAPVATCAMGPASQRWCRGDDRCWVPGWHNAPVPTWGGEAAMFAPGGCFNGGGMFPAGSEWNRPVLSLPRHPRSDDWITTVGVNKPIWPAFGTLYEGRPNGFLVTYISGATVPRQKVRFLYASESDNVAAGYPLLPDVPIEDHGCESNGDRHMLVVDRQFCLLYETFKTSVRSPEEVNVTADGFPFTADSGAVWNLRSRADGATGARPPGAQLGWTSADAAGLPILPGLVMYHEAVVVGEIRHALRFTVKSSSMGYLFPPATHYASSNRDATLPPMGARFRLNPAINCTSVMTSPPSRAICRALQVYGMFLADNGGDGAISGQAHPDWDDTALAELRRLNVGMFEAVETGAVLCTTPSCSDALPNAPPQRPSL
jgi:hypothetical protein